MFRSGLKALLELRNRAGLVRFAIENGLLNIH